MSNTPTESPATTATFVAAPRTGDFEGVINLLSVLGEANRQMDTLTTDVEVGYLQIVTTKRDAYAKLQTTVGETEAAIEVIARRNPQWFSDKKTITTPYGIVKMKSSKEIVVANEEASIVLMLAAKRRELVRRKIEINLEALQELPDAELAKFGISRRLKENITIETSVVDLGKAVKSATKSEAGAKKSATKAAALTGQAGFTLVEIIMVCVIIALLAAMVIPTIKKIRGGSTDTPPVATVLERTDGEDRFTLVRVSEFRDSFAYDNRRAVYVVTDKQTGAQFVGVSGIEITEIARHSTGKNTSVEDER